MNEPRGRKPPVSIREALPVRLSRWLLSFIRLAPPCLSILSSRSSSVSVSRYQMIDAGSTLRGRYISRQEDKYSSEYPDLDEQSANDVKAESRFVKVTKQFRRSSTRVLARYLPSLSFILFFIRSGLFYAARCARCSFAFYEILISPTRGIAPARGRGHFASTAAYFVSASAICSPHARIKESITSAIGRLA